MRQELKRMTDDRRWPQAGKTRMIMRSPVGTIGTQEAGADDDHKMLAMLDDKHVFMMGDNPALPRMPEKPTLLDFFRYRFNAFAVNHLLGAARRALADGHSEKVAMACMLHDISNGCLV